MGTNQTSAAMPDIRDIKPPFDTSSTSPWFWWVVLALAVFVGAMLLWWLLKKRQSQVELPPPLPAHLRAKKKLEQALALLAQPKPFVVAVSDTARSYLEERFSFRAPERTTEEFLRELAGTKLLLPDQKESLGQFLESCDLVKFAKYEPGETELLALHGSALRLVEETEPQTTGLEPPVLTTQPPPVPVAAGSGPVDGKSSTVNRH